MLGGFYWGWSVRGGIRDTGGRDINCGLFLVPLSAEPVWAPLSFPVLEPLVMRNAIKGLLSVPCKTKARLFFAGFIPYHLNIARGYTHCAQWSTHPARRCDPEPWVVNQSSIIVPVPGEVTTRQFKKYPAGVTFSPSYNISPAKHESCASKSRHVLSVQI